MNIELCNIEIELVQELADEEIKFNKLLDGNTPNISERLEELENIQTRIRSLESLIANRIKLKVQMGKH